MMSSVIFSLYSMESLLRTSYVFAPIFILIIFILGSDVTQLMFCIDSYSFI